MSETCRQETCCDPLDGLSGVVVADPGTTFGGSGVIGGGEGGEDPGCNKPTVTLSVDKLTVKCGQQYTLSWNTKDVGQGGTVTLTDLGNLTPDSSGSHTFTFGLADTQSLSYMLTATNGCGTSTATVTITLDTVVGMKLEMTPDNMPCGTPTNYALAYATWDVDPMATVSVTAEPAVTGFPKLLEPNTEGTHAFATVPPADTVFTLTVTDRCSTHAETVTVEGAGSVSSSIDYLKAEWTDCNVYTLTWEGAVCYPPATITIQGPQQTPDTDEDCHTPVEHALPGEMEIDARQWAGCFTKTQTDEGAALGLWYWEAQYSYTVSTDGGEAYQGGLLVYAYPEMEGFDVLSTGTPSITVNCPTSGGGFFLDLICVAWFCNTFNVYNETAGNVLLGTFTGDGGPHSTATMTVFVESPTSGNTVTLRCEPVVASDCPVKACEPFPTITVTFADAPCADCTPCTEATGIPATLKLGYDFSGCITPALNWDELKARTVVDPFNGYVVQWDRVLHKSLTPGDCLYAGVIDMPYPVGVTEAEVFEAGNSLDNHLVYVTLWFSMYQVPNGVCSWTLRVGPVNVEEKNFTYIKYGGSPVGTYHKNLPWDAAIDPDFFPDEIQIFIVEP